MLQELIMGANGFLGQYLAWSRRGADCLLHSRTQAGAPCLRTGLPFVQEDLVETREALAATRPETVYLLARPVTQDGGVFQRFAANVQALLRLWADSGCLRRVVFASTQLVYATPTDDIPLPAATSPLGPETPYDCHKAEMERFLEALTDQYNGGIRAEVFRLPLLGGRQAVDTQNQEQILYQWRDAYRSGRRWVFPTHAACERWGNSWVHTDDVVRLMTTPAASGPRFSVVQPVSGHLCYVDLDLWFQAHSTLPPPCGRLHLPRTSFFLEDNAGTPPRRMADAFADAPFPGMDLAGAWRFGRRQA